MQEELWKDAFDRVDRWGEIATGLFNKQRQKQLNPGRKPTPKIVWRIPRTSKLRKALWQAIKRPGEEEVEEPEQHTPSAWTVSYIYRGLVPKVLAKQWSKVFKDAAESITQHVSRLFFCRYVKKEAKGELWKPHYERTIMWEENSTTNSMKRTHTTKDQGHSGHSPTSENRSMGGNSERMSALRMSRSRT
ncbi:hypothetical protein EC957_001392 [Mortierella hygrophila]|uniref:Uncharacterized protein n=1 Tax=Mortierella hygrophila TaxID=979708 RepID=A0A9P6K2E6_9FUNG|nr:hypothetical protein EC957_001392 [Mortierella hygrophila]